jgi:hypothetical protein
MMRPRFSIARSALALMSRQIVAMQITLALVVFALLVLWLRLPDSSALSLVATVLVGVLLLGIAGGGEAAILLRLCGRPLTFRLLFRGAVLLLIAALLWLGWSALLVHLSGNDSTLAGYWNSRFPASMRNVFSYAHIYRGLEWMWSALSWIGAGVAVVFAVGMTVSEHPRKAIRSTLLSFTFWITLVCVSLCASFLTGVVMQWTPGRGLAIEMISLIVRLSGVVIVDAIFAVGVLAVIAVCIQRSESIYATPAGIPDESQLRTDVRP